MKANTFSRDMRQKKNNVLIMILALVGTVIIAASLIFVTTTDRGIKWSQEFTENNNQRLNYSGEYSREYIDNYIPNSWDYRNGFISNWRNTD